MPPVVDRPASAGRLGWLRAVSRVSAVAAGLTGLMLLACATAGCTPAVDPTAASRSAFGKRAVQVARDWEASPAGKSLPRSLVLLSDVMWRPYLYSDRDPSVHLDEPTIGALTSDWYVLDLSPSRPPVPTSGVVTFADGDTLTVPLESPVKAAKGFIQPAPPPCPVTRPSVPGASGPASGCVRLRITGVTMGARHLLTGRGEADLPVWRYAIDGLGTPLERVAVDPGAYSLPPAGSSGGTQNTGPGYVSPGFARAQSLQAIGGRALTYRVWCGERVVRDLEPLVYEDAKTVVIGATAVVPGGNMLTLQMNLVSVTLARPLGDRVVLDAVTGRLLSLWQPF